MIPAPGGTIGVRAAATVRKFCSDCGAAWNAQWSQCQACLARRALIAQTPQIPAQSHGVPSALILYFLLLGVCLISMLVGRAGSNQGHASLVAMVVMSALVIAWAAVQWEGNFASLLRVPALNWFVLAIGVSFVTFGIATGVMQGLRIWLDLPPLNTSIRPAHSGYGWGLIVLVVAVQPAIIEELAFRGIILESLQRTLKVSEAIVVGAMMFMVLHLNPVRFPHTLALGLATGILRVRSKSILPCMALHFSHNFLCVVMEWAGG
jgi:membrane protease YdiL (CAAX protease family)